MADADAIGALVELLADFSGTAALADIHIYGGELPADLAGLMPRGALLIKPSGGVSMMTGSFVEHDTQRVDITAYGRTLAEAAELMRAVTYALRNVRREIWAGTLIHWVESAGGFLSGREAQTEWPRVWRSFQIFHALESVD